MIMDQTVECPCCGSNDVYGVTRVVGYFAIIENMNDSKKGEIRDRKIGNYSINSVNPPVPLKFNLGKDGIYLIGKDECTICVSEKDIILKAIKDADLFGKVELFEKKIANNKGEKNPKHLSFAVMANVDLNKIPAVVAIKDGTVRYLAHIGDTKNPVTLEELTRNFLEVYSEVSPLTVI